MVNLSIQIHAISSGYAEKTVITKFLTGKTVCFGVPKTSGPHSEEGCGYRSKTGLWRNVICIMVNSLDKVKPLRSSKTLNNYIETYLSPSPFCSPITT